MLVYVGLCLLKHKIGILGHVIWYDRVVGLAVDKLHDSIDEIPKLCKQFIVILCNEISPLELAVGRLFEYYHLSALIILGYSTTLLEKMKWDP